jgi:hypothetical protein
MTAIEAWDEDAPEQYPNRWSIGECFSGDPFDDRLRFLHTFGVPTDYSGMKQLRDLVPYGPKTLERMTAKHLSRSPNYAPRLKSDANYAHQNLKQRFPSGGPSHTRQSPCLPFESGIAVLPGMEHLLDASERRAIAGHAGQNSWGGE